MMTVVVGVVCFVVAALAVWAVMAARMRFERQLRDQERAAAESLRAAEEKHVQTLVEGALERFKNVSNAALKANGDEFRALNAGELEHILKPLRESVERFTTGSTSFVNAITGGNKVAGNWGEAVLDQLLADCGLVRDVHYIAQGGGTGNIPDYQVFDAASRKILVIDSKVSWKKYKEMSDSDDPAVRATALAEHVESIRRQIDNLGSKRYHENPNPPRAGFKYLPFSAMFVPSDAALWEAVKKDPTIPAYAYRKGVVLVTPTSLFGFMRLIHEGWSLYNTQKNQELIAHEANLVVERIDKLFKALEEADKAYLKAHEQLMQAMKLASSEGQCVKGPALKIVKLREKAEKPLKSRTLGDAASDEGEGAEHREDDRDADSEMRN